MAIELDKSTVIPHNLIAQRAFGGTYNRPHSVDTGQHGQYLQVGYLLRQFANLFQCFTSLQQIVPNKNCLRKRDFLSYLW